jgi:hypothetical protein
MNVDELHGVLRIERRRTLAGGVRHPFASKRRNSSLIYLVNATWTFSRVSLSSYLASTPI